MMWIVKQVFDPKELLNPGKIFPPSVANVERAARVVSEEGAVVVDEVFTPWTVEEAAQGLASLSAAGRRVRIVGVAPPYSGDAIGQVPQDVLVCTSALRGVKGFSPDDLYITVGAGTRLGEIRTFLESSRMQVPLASPWPQATIGGLMAANVNAPLRMRYGSMRDLVICATVVLANGQQIRVGRPVIKNVAGYDLVKVFIGSHGTLGLIAHVTLKLMPLPRLRRTLLVPRDDLQQGLALARRMLSQSLVASAILLCKGCDLSSVKGLRNSVYTLVYTAEGVAEDVQAELEQVRQVLHMGEVRESEAVEVESLSGTDVWVSMLGNSEQGTMKVRVGVAAKDVAAYVREQGDTLEMGAFIVDVACGQVFAVLSSDNMNVASKWLKGLRQTALMLEGYAVVLDMPENWQGRMDRWGYRPEAIELMRGLKRRWDPAGILTGAGFIEN
jgi:FAD/FMN-containing dehydrogenase